MSADADSTSSNVPPPSPPPASASSSEEPSVILVSYPKIVFMWPTLLVSIIAAIAVAIAGQDSSTSQLMAWLFLFVLGTNGAVISFDFPRGTSLTLFFVIVAILLGFVLVSMVFPGLLPFLSDNIPRLHPTANAEFYGVIATTFVFIFLFVFVNRKFDYWEVKPNELLHHHGLMSDLERFAAPNLKIDKEINDVFEYILFRSGRLTLHPSNAPKSIVLDNVYNISKKEKDITRMLSALQVQVRET